MDISIEHQRFKQIREELKFTQAEFGEKLELGFSTADIERGRTRLSGKVVMILLKEFNINPLWLYGESNKKQLDASETQVSPKSIVVDSQGGENICLVPVKAAAGYGQNLYDTAYLSKLPSFDIPLAQFRNASYRGFEISGDSMQPLVYSGDWVLAQALESISQVKDGDIYVIVERDSIRLKKVFRKPEHLELISLNPEYAPTATSLDNVLELWKYHSKISFGIEHIQGISLQRLYDEVADLKRKLDA